MSEDCLFCRLTRAPDEYRANHVYADERVVAWPVLHPVNPGHLIVVPREHVRNAYNLPPDLAGHMVAVAARLGQVAAREFGFESTSLLLNNEAPAQSVFHAHLHAIPRSVGDALYTHEPQASPEALADHAARLRAALARIEE